jgi:hypothetical protein
LNDVSNLIAICSHNFILNDDRGTARLGNSLVAHVWHK